jgi:hypothetical protein
VSVQPNCLGTDGADLREAKLNLTCEAEAGRSQACHGCSSDPGTSGSTSLPGMQVCVEAGRTLLRQMRCRGRRNTRTEQKPMTTRRTGQKKKQSQRKPAGHGTIEREANLGQKEARLDKEKESELSNMGERSRRDQRPS